MSYYGTKNCSKQISIVKRRVQQGEIFRFNGLEHALAYKVSDFSTHVVGVHQTGVKIVDAAEGDCVMVGVQAIHQPNTAIGTVVVSNVEFVDTTDSYELPANKTAAVLEGSITLGEVTFDSNTDIGFIEKSESAQLLTGNSKLVIFDTTPV